MQASKRPGVGKPMELVQGEGRLEKVQSMGLEREPQRLMSGRLEGVK